MKALVNDAVADLADLLATVPADPLERLPDEMASLIPLMSGRPEAARPVARR